MSNLCAVCKKGASQTCSACGQVYYCSRDHQKQDWKNHKQSCGPFKVEFNEIMGRYLVATRDIQAGEVIMNRPPLILGPKTVSVPLCLGCHRKLNLDKNPRYECSKCRWPLCNPVCEDSPLHVKECEVFSKSRYTPLVKNDCSIQSVYSSITPLRALLLSKSKLKSLLECQSHLEKHLATPIYQILRRNLVPFFNDVLKVETSEEELLTVCSVFDTNCFEVRDGDGFVNVRGLYPTASLLAHDCKHNTKHSFHGDDFRLVLTATVPIKKGESITTTYTQTLWGTLARRAHLKQVKHFDCTCSRCKDPTEFGCYVGSVSCTKCRSMMVSCDPLDREADWKCENCDQVVEGGEIAWKNELLKKEISQLNKHGPEDLEEFLIKYETVLHPKNMFVLQVKHALSQIYGNMEGYKLEELPQESIDRKIELCRELLDVADVLEPGHSRFRGSLLLDLYEAMVAKCKRDLSAGRITKEKFKGALSEARVRLEEADEISKSDSDLNRAVQIRKKKFTNNKMKSL